MSVAHVAPAAPAPGGIRGAWRGDDDAGDLRPAAVGAGGGVGGGGGRRSGGLVRHLWCWTSLATDP